MGILHRAISADGSVVVSALDGTDIVAAIEQYHRPSAVVTAALGRLAIAGSLMGYGLKSKDDSVTIRIDGEGEIGMLTVVADSEGNVKCCADNYICEIPLRTDGKLDVGGAVGRGNLSVIKDMGLKDPYVGTIPLVSGEIAEDLAQYFADSEQIPTVLSLGVLVNPDLRVACAGGFLLQLLPFADESCIPILEDNMAKMPPITSLLQDGMTADEIALKCLEGLEPNLLDTANPEYRCTCSRERTEGILKALGPNALEDLAREGDDIEVCCHFCDKIYSFAPSELLAIQ